MSYAEEQTPANVIAHAVGDIVVNGSQRHRELCFQIAGVSSSTELTLFVERELGHFFRREDSDARQMTRNAEINWLFNSRFSSLHPLNGKSSFDAFRVQSITADFSSAEDEIDTDTEELFNSPPDNAHISEAAFSPEPDSPSSTIYTDVSYQQSQNHDDFSNDEFEEDFVVNMPPVIKRFSRSLTLAKDAQKSASVSTSSNKNMFREEITSNEFSD